MVTEAEWRLEAGGQCGGHIWSLESGFRGIE